MIVSTSVFLAIRYGLAVDPVHALVPPLVTFLPGAMLTLGMVELAYGDMVISGFFGTLVATPLGYLIQLRFKGPPAAVTFLPSFWLLVPGALGLLSVTRMMSDRIAGLNDIITVLFVVASIALGTLVGASLYRGLTESCGAWQLQIGRVGSFFRRTDKR
jgi:uncharacterized membrane protein YjjB (DUF3815 family)